MLEGFLILLENIFHVCFEEVMSEGFISRLDKYEIVGLKELSSRGCDELNYLKFSKN